MYQYFPYVPFVYNKLYLKQVYGNFPGSVHNKQSAEKIGRQAKYRFLPIFLDFFYISDLTQKRDILNYSAI